MKERTEKRYTLATEQEESGSGECKQLFIYNGLNDASHT